MRQCGHCCADISDRPAQSRYCTGEQCQLERKQAHGRTDYHRHRAERREVQNAAYHQRMAERPNPPRSCGHCGTDITHRGRKAKWCDMRCRDRARQAERFVHRWNQYAARVQRDAGFPVDPPISDADWARILPEGARCQYCGDPAAEPDHVVPLSRGGRHDPSNIVPACMPCNRAKRHVSADEFVRQQRH